MPLLDFPRAAAYLLRSALLFAILVFATEALGGELTRYFAGESMEEMPCIALRLD
jgi:hypothetical protein